MTTDLAERRKGRTLTLFLIAGALIAVAAVTLAIEYRAARPDLASGPVIPRLEETIREGQRIIVTSSEATYRIERVERGGESVWVMRDRGDYPVLGARLAQLTEGLEGLRYTRRMTSDPTKHARLGVDDPRERGRGVLVQIEDAQGALLVNLILGVEPSGLYVRRPDDDQAWGARGELPPLRNVATWLDLQPIQVPPERLARVEIMPRVGRAYILGRDEPQQEWRMVQPALAVLAQSSVAAAAERITQLQPVDVQPAPAVQGPAVARVRAVTFDGVLIDAELVEADGRLWLKLVARSAAETPTPEQEAAALEISNRVAAWAYALNDMDADALAPPLNALIPGATDE
jgi:hypothetical protein